MNRLLHLLILSKRTVRVVFLLQDLDFIIEILLAIILVLLAKLIGVQLLVLVYNVPIVIVVHVPLFLRQYIQPTVTSHLESIIINIIPLNLSHMISQRIVAENKSPKFVQ
jgi:hypothetical protein